jgi:hypothetical protein
MARITRSPRRPLRLVSLPRGAFLDSVQCLELIEPATVLLQQQIEGQEWADRNGRAEDWNIPFFEELVDKLKAGAGE